MKIEEFKCPSCGAPIPKEAIGNTYECPYCKTSLIIEKEEIKEEKEEPTVADKSVNIFLLVDKKAVRGLATAAVIGTMCVSRIVNPFLSNNVPNIANIHNNNKTVASNELNPLDVYNLPGGYDLECIDGEWYATRTKTETMAANMETIKTLPSGYTAVEINGEICGKKTTTVTKPATATTTYRIPEEYADDYVLVGTKGVNDAGETVNAVAKTTYSADSGWVLSGTYQTKTTTSYVPAVTVRKFSANAGWTLKGDKQTRTITERIPVTKKNNYNYSSKNYNYSKTIPYKNEDYAYTKHIKAA